MTWRSWPGPVAFFAALVLAVPVPLLGYAATHRAEEILAEGPAVGWWVVAAIALLAASARRWVAGLVAGALFGLAAGAFYHWVVPREGVPIAAAVVVLLIGAAVGEALGRRAPRPMRPVTRIVLGGVLTLLGAHLATESVQQGAGYSLEVGPAGDTEFVAGESAAYSLDANRDYSVLAVSSPATRPQCRVTGPDGVSRAAESMPVQPETPGFDGTAGYRWIATFRTGAAGSYTAGCEGGTSGSSYAVGGVPAIDGAVASLVHWPRPILWLIGALPGLVLAAQGVTRALRSRERRA